MSDKQIDIQVGVKIVLVNSQFEILLLQRSKEKYPKVNDYWDIIGGRVIAGNSLIDNLKREVMEETGITLLNDEIKLLTAQDIILDSSKHIVRLTYLGYTDEDPRLSDEHDTYNWFRLDELKNKKNEHIDKYFQEIVDSKIIDNLLFEKVNC